MSKYGWMLALVAVAALPLAADRLRGRAERCTFDGVEVGDGFRVRIIDDGDRTRSFCGVRCAQSWLARSQVRPQEILVTDSLSGTEIGAESAWFVRSVSVWSHHAPDFIRVFASRGEAERHAKAFGGTILSGAQRPFAAERGQERASAGN